MNCDQAKEVGPAIMYKTVGQEIKSSHSNALLKLLPWPIVRLIRTISLHFIVESQTWYQNDRGVMLISNQSDAKIIGLGSRAIIGLNWP